MLLPIINNQYSETVVLYSMDYIYVYIDKTMKNFEVKNIKNSENVKETLSDLIEEARRANRVSSREFMTEIEDDEEV